MLGCNGGLRSAVAGVRVVAGRCGLDCVVIWELDDKPLDDRYISAIVIASAAFAWIVWYSAKFGFITSA